jgi:hypothetical protein
MIMMLRLGADSVCEGLTAVSGGHSDRVANVVSLHLALLVFRLPVLGRAGYSHPQCTRIAEVKNQRRIQKAASTKYSCLRTWMVRILARTSVRGAVSGSKSDAVFFCYSPPFQANLIPRTHH